MSTDESDTAVWRIRTTRELKDAKDRQMQLEMNVRIMEEQHAELRRALSDNTRVTIDNAGKIESISNSLTALATSLSGIIKMSNSIDGTLDIAGRVGGFAKWVAVMGTLATITWAVFKYIVSEATRK